VLVAIAVPGYRNHVLRSHRGDARAALARLQVAQDNYFAAHSRYASAAELELDSQPGAYVVTVEVAGDGLGYTATASVQPGTESSEDTHCRQFRVDQNGNKFATDAAGADQSADCWR